MIQDKKVLKILERVHADISPDRAECAYLLGFHENSLEAYLVRSVAAHIIRSRNDNSAIILGQIGVEVFPCPGNCGFCAFGKDHTKFEKKRIAEEEFVAKVTDFSKDGDLYGLYLLAMHEYDLTFYLDMVCRARRIVPAATKLLSNVGDTDVDVFKEMKKAGITGVYHTCRIGEGTDTSLEPEKRLKTMQNVLDAGLEVYSCCEPIGPEHTIEQLVDNMFIGIDLGCTQHAAMRRVAVPGTPLAKYGQISELRLAQIVAVVALASFTVPTMTYMGVHEPNELGYVAGANVITAETGVNPRDYTTETSNNRGIDMAVCRKMLLDCGFSYIRRGDESKIPLDLDYLYKTNSI